MFSLRHPEGDPLPLVIGLALDFDRLRGSPGGSARLVIRWHTAALDEPHGHPPDHLVGSPRLPAGLHQFDLGWRAAAPGRKLVDRRLRLRPQRADEQPSLVTGLKVSQSGQEDEL